MSRFVLTRREIGLAALATGVASTAEADDDDIMPRGAPRGRIGGSTRGPSPATIGLNLQLGAPVGRHEVGVLDPAPTLVFTTARGSDLPVRFAIASRTDPVPVVLGPLPRIRSGGLHLVSVAAFGVKLPVDRLLIWSVSILVNEADPSGDLVAVGLIRHQPASAGLSGRLAAAGDASRAAILVRSGFWYDAVSAAARDPARRRSLVALLASQGIAVPV